MDVFGIQPIDRFRSASTAIRRPKEIACFSYDDTHQFRLDDSSLRYYYPPRLPANLSDGFDTFKKLDDTADDHLDSLLKTVLEKEKVAGVRFDVDFLTWRGMMTKIMATPYEQFNGFEMNATLFEGTIFIEENHEYKLSQWASQRSNRGRHPQDLMSFWGYKFETLCLLPDTWGNTSRAFIENRQNEIVDNHAQYCSVVKTGIGKNKMILGGEVDAVWDSKPKNPEQPINWVELKTSEEVLGQGPRAMDRFERKLLKFWVQSFLLGVPKIVVGFRSRDGILERLESLDTGSIPNNVKKRGNASWDGNTCINFTAEFLEWLKQTISSEGVWRIRRAEKSSRIEVFKLEETGHGSILSDEFLSWRAQLSARSAQEEE